MADAVNRPMSTRLNAGSLSKLSGGSFRLGGMRIGWPAGAASVAALAAAVAGLLDDRHGPALLAAAALTGLLILARARFRDWLYPPVLQAGLWAVLCVWFWLMQDRFYGIDRRTWWVIILGAISFSIGAWLTTRHHSPVLNRNTLARGSLPSALAEGIVLTVSLCFLAASLRAASAVTTPGAYLSFISEVREAHLDDTAFGRLYIGFWWTLTYLGVCLLHVLENPQRLRRRVLLLLATVLAIAYAIVMGGHQFPLFVLIIICGPLLLLRRARLWKVAAAFSVTVIIISVSISFLAGQMDLSVHNASMNDLRTVGDLASVYMVGPFVAFDSLTPPVNRHFGVNTFRIVYLWLERFGYNAEVEPIIPPWINISRQWATNIYTVYYGPYLDFGLIGVCACQLMFGCWHGMLYRRATQPQPRAIWVMLFVIFLFPLIMQATTDTYLPAFSNWLNFGLIFVLAFVILGASHPILRRLHLKPAGPLQTRG